MNIILFGPPGVGKSTLIGLLKSEGFRAIDLEDIYPSKIRFQLPSMVDGVVFGAADLNPARKYTNVKKVLLYLQQGDYVQRRAQRDKLVPSKGKQAEQNIDMWKRTVKWDYIIDASASEAKTKQQVMSILRKEI